MSSYMRHEHKRTLFMKCILFCLLALVLGFPAVSQNTQDTMNNPYWVDMMQDPEQNFFQTQRAFELYWQNRAIEKGSGYKPFKRWEFSIFPLVQPNGGIMGAGQVCREIENWQRNSC